MEFSALVGGVFYFSVSSDLGLLDGLVAVGSASSNRDTRAGLPLGHFAQFRLYALLNAPTRRRAKDCQKISSTLRLRVNVADLLRGLTAKPFDFVA
jgi:hypothetical protein